jgi:hypothetical protein
VSSRQLSDNKPHAPDERPHISDARLTDLYIGIGAACFLIGVSGLGKLGYGIFNTLMVFTFVARFYRPRWRLVVLGFAAVYLGLSVYVTYMRDRGGIRDTGWGEQSYGSRLDQLKATLGQAEFFDLVFAGGGFSAGWGIIC